MLLAMSVRPYTAANVCGWGNLPNWEESRHLETVRGRNIKSPLTPITEWEEMSRLLSNPLSLS
jgi:hypothetical protein